MTTGEINKKEKRRVRFPEDNKLISDYLEPFRPAPDNCTNEELITAYLSSCYQYKVSPIEFLLEQLKGIDLSICNERYSRLSLRDIRLNRSHIETMEEIFRRVHFKELDFENTFLDDQSATALFDMLIHYESCCNLRVSLNLDKFNPSQAWQRCVNFIRKSLELRQFTMSHTPLTIVNFMGLSFFGLCLDQLSLIDCNINGQTLFALVRWLRILLSSPSLHPPMRVRSTTGQSKKCGVNSLSNSFHRMRSSVLENSHSAHRTVTSNEPPLWNLRLCLSHNKLSKTDAETLIYLVRHQLLVVKPQLKEKANISRLTDSNVGNNMAVVIGGIGYVSELDLSHNNLGDEGVKILCSGLLQSYRGRLRDIHPGLTTTINEESGNTSTSAGLMEEISDLDCFTTSTVIEPTVIAKGVERLCLGDNNLTGNGLRSLACVLMHTSESLVHIVGGLVSLDLSFNMGIGNEGVEILCEGLMRNHSLKELFLRSIHMSFPGIFALSCFLSEAKCLCLLDIRNNLLDLASLMALAKTLALNKTLTSLFSDSRHLIASTSGDLGETDRDLISELMETIEGFLRRNRCLLELSSNGNKEPPTYSDNKEFVKSMEQSNLSIELVSKRAATFDGSIPNSGSKLTQVNSCDYETTLLNSDLSSYLTSTETNLVDLEPSTSPVPLLNCQGIVSSLSPPMTRFARDINSVFPYDVKLLGEIHNNGNNIKSTNILHTPTSRDSQKINTCQSSQRQPHSRSLPTNNILRTIPVSDLSLSTHCVQTSEVDLTLTSISSKLDCSEGEPPPNSNGNYLESRVFRPKEACPSL